MNLPYVVSDTYSFFVLLITFGLIVIGFAIIISLNLFFIKNSKIKNEKLYSKSFPTSMKLAYKSNKALERSKKYKVDIMSEEIDAWRKGRELANRLDIYIDEEKYYKVQTECLYSYIQHLARFA